ncbi:metaxin-1-like, partial [Perca flavescens]|uniref:metaxin-1-like n=1 Tax=Perca flavescens TaxID=8167 RepID=UPI00106E8B9F
PSSLDAYVFGHLAPVLKSKLPNGKLQQHLKSLDNLSNFCSNVLLLYFPRDGREGGAGAKASSSSSSSSSPPDGDFDHVPNKRRKQLLSALAALGAMLGYALLTGIVSVQHAQRDALEDRRTRGNHDDEDEDGDG